MTNLQLKLEQQQLEQEQENQQREQYLELYKSMECLQEIQKDLNQYINGHRYKFDSIKENIDSTNYNIESGLENLVEAQSLSVKYTPIVLGTVIGALVGGPFGLIPGLKAGTIIGSSSFGVLGGWLGYKAQK
tara:strand:- start:604 stop:999 length:396 start_codon:yes stop_codon:yes gene_type:complete